MRLKIVSMLLIVTLLIATNTVQSTNIGDNSISLSRRHRMIEKAAEISDKAMEAAYQTLKRVFRENITEAHVVTALQQSIIENGSDPSEPEAPAFYFTVAAGNDSVIPHGIPENDPSHIIKPGDTVVIDMGARYKGYVSDITRTFFIGEPTEYQKEVYNIVLEANKVTIEDIRSFVPFNKLEKTSRRVISSYGYGELRYFPHSVSHGLGFLCHAKYPTQSWYRPGSRFGGNILGYMPLLPGMVITVEPGIYIKEEGFGIRIEDDIAVRLFGYEILTHYPKELEDVIIHCGTPEFFDDVSINIEPNELLDLDFNEAVNCSITAYNPSDMSVEVNITVDSIPEGWSVDIIPDFVVGAGSKTSENLRIQAPEDFDGAEKIDLTVSYCVSVDPYIKGKTSTVSLTIKSIEEVIPHFEYVLAAVVLIILIAILAILLWKRYRF